MTTGLMPTPTGKNPFKVGDTVVCVEGGFCDLVEGQSYIVTRTTDKCVSWQPDGRNGGMWTRFRPAVDTDIISSEAGEAYDEAMQAVEAFELVNRG